MTTTPPSSGIFAAAGPPPVPVLDADPGLRDVVGDRAGRPAAAVAARRRGRRDPVRDDLARGRRDSARDPRPPLGGAHGAVPRGRRRAGGPLPRALAEACDDHGDRAAAAPRPAALAAVLGARGPL